MISEEKEDTIDINDLGMDVREGSFGKDICLTWGKEIMFMWFGEARGSWAKWC